MKYEIGQKVYFIYFEKLASFKDKHESIKLWEGYVYFIKSEITNSETKNIYVICLKDKPNIYCEIYEDFIFDNYDKALIKYRKIIGDYC